MPKPFIIASDWLDYAHGPGAEDEQPMAVQIMKLADASKMVRMIDPLMVAEVADVAELFFGDGDDEEIKARRAFTRAVKWLRANDWADWRKLHEQGMRVLEGK